MLEGFRQELKTILANTKVRLLSDEQICQLVKQAQSGSKKALTYLFDSFAPFRKGLAKKYTNRGLNNEDIFQEVDTLFCCAILDYDSTKDPSPTRHIVSKTRRDTWNYYAKQMNWFKPRNTIYYENTSELEKLLEKNALGATYTDTYDDIESLDVRNAVNTLPQNQKTVVYLYYWKDMRQSNIAEYAFIHQSNVSRQLKSARNKLKYLL